MGREDALRYAIAPLAHGVRRALGVELWEQQRQTVIPKLQATFGGVDELKVALEDAFERSLQSIVIGLKAPWLLMETGEKDYCEAFAKNVREPFSQEAQIEGRLLIDFLDGFFLDYDTALDAAPVILGLPYTPEESFFEQLIAAADSEDDPNELASRATARVKEGFVAGVGLEEEHPAVRLGQWRDLIADGVIFHFAEIARAHPSWSRYLDLLDEEKLSRQDMRAAAARDDRERRRVAQARGLLKRIEDYRSAFGEIIPNREWLFDIADRLEDSDESVESDLLQGKAMLARDLPLLVETAVKKIAGGHGLTPIVRASDALLEPKASTIEVLRRARRDFRRCHWTGDRYAVAAYELGSLIFSVFGPRNAERYFRESLAFQGDQGACEYALYLAAIALEDRRSAIHHLQAAVKANADAYEPFDMTRYTLDAILGAGGTGVSFLVGADGKDLVVKTFWDEIAVVDPRPALKDLQRLVKAKVKGAAKIHHLCGYKKRVTFVVSDHVEGENLEDFREAQGGEAPAKIVAQIGADAAAILSRAHDAGVTHRNLKPGNIRIAAGEEGWEVTLTDFCVPNYILALPDRIRGIRRLAQWSRLGRQIAEDLAAYTAPEVLKGGLTAFTPAADIYSLGATLYRLATGASARKIDPEGLPAEIRDVIVRCVAKNPAERPATAEQVREALARAQRRLDDSSGTFGALPPTAPMQTINLTESQENEFGLSGLATAPDPFAPTADPFAPPGVDDFGMPLEAPPPGRAAPPATNSFALPEAPFAPAADPFDAPAADPFGAPAADPFAAPAANPFGAPAADPFGAPAADPFGAPAADPFGAPVADPFGAPVADPFGAPAADPFAPVADPFGAPVAKGRDLMGAASSMGPALDPFAPVDGEDPFAGAGTGVLKTQDPFAAPRPATPPQSMPRPATPKPLPRPTRKTAKQEEEEEEVPLDPADALALLENLMQKKGGTATKKKPAAAPAPKAKGAAPAAPADPFAAPVPDPFAPSGDPFGVPDPFAAPAPDPFGGPPPADPFGGPPPGDPFGGPPPADPFGGASAADPFAAPVDPFAAPVDPFAAPVDPFGATAPQNPVDSQVISDPLAPGQGGMFFSSELAPPGPDLAVPLDDLPMLEASAEAPPEPPSPTDPAVKKKGAAKPAGKPAASPKAEPKLDEEGYGLVVSGLALKSKKEAAIAIICEIRGISKDEAYDLCRSPVVPVLKRVTKEEAEAAAEKFKAAKVNCRITERKDRR
ncbi:MAG TPA: protein kinase [Planctomycetota bacterium]|nr:protein kinase [Planctomycetota bacterium]